MSDLLNYDVLNKSLTNICGDGPSNVARLRHRRSLDYGYSGGVKTTAARAVTDMTYVRPSILIRRQSSERCLQKRHSVDSNKSNSSDPGLTFGGKATVTNSAAITGVPNPNSLIPGQQRSPRGSNSPKSCFSSFASVNVRDSTYSSMLLSREGSIGSHKRQSDDNLDNQKWFSSSSVILTRVKSMKEKFRRVVVQSVQPDDWPPPSVLFSERYRYPSPVGVGGSSQSSVIANSSANIGTTDCLNGGIGSSGGSGAIKARRASLIMMKSKSIDQAHSVAGRKGQRSSVCGSISLQIRRAHLQRSATSYTGNYDPECSSASDNGIVCTNLDLKEIINNFKREEGAVRTVSEPPRKQQGQQFISKTPTASSTSIGPGFGKRKLMRKQVSFDDEQGVMVINRKVSAIAEEIESHISGDSGDRRCSNSGVVPTGEPENKETEDDLLTTSTAGRSNIVSNDLLEGDENCCPETEEPQSDAADPPSPPPSPSASPLLMPLLPKEVEFDEHGQTWEVYGADPDPEILGHAIQSHLERLMQQCRQQQHMSAVMAVSASPVTLPNGDCRISNSSGSMGTPPTAAAGTGSNPLKPLRADLRSAENQLRLLVRRLCGRWSCLSQGQSSTSSPSPADQGHRRVVVSLSPSRPGHPV